MALIRPILIIICFTIIESALEGAKLTRATKGLPKPPVKPKATAVQWTPDNKLASRALQARLERERAEEAKKFAEKYNNGHLRNEWKEKKADENKGWNALMEGQLSGLEQKWNAIEKEREEATLLDRIIGQCRGNSQLEGEYIRIKAEYDKIMAKDYDEHKRKEELGKMLGKLGTSLKKEAEKEEGGTAMLAHMNRQLYVKLALEAQSIPNEFARITQTAMAKLTYDGHKDMVSFFAEFLAEYGKRQFEVVKDSEGKLVPAASEVLKEMDEMDTFFAKKKETSWKEIFGIEEEWQKMGKILVFEKQEVQRAISATLKQ